MSLDPVNTKSMPYFLQKKEKKKEKKKKRKKGREEEEKKSMHGLRTVKKL
jgi:hypothetical protein